MKDSWDKAIEFVLQAEGGDTVTENPSDPGGLTKYGISKKAYPELDIRNLTEEQAKAIYYKDYWTKTGCDRLPYPLDMCVFDCAVNQGVATALSLLNPDMEYLSYLFARIDRYISISAKNDKLKVFFRGWVIRINNLRKAVED